MLINLECESKQAQGKCMHLASYQVKGEEVKKQNCHF